MRARSVLVASLALHGVVLAVLARWAPPAADRAASTAIAIEPPPRRTVVAADAIEVAIVADDEHGEYGEHGEYATPARRPAMPSQSSRPGAIKSQSAASSLEPRASVTETETETETETVTETSRARAIGSEL